MFRKAFKKLFKNKNENSKSYKREKAKFYDNKLLKYVTERFETGDVVVAKDGYITVKNGFLYICCGAKMIFKCDIEELTCGDLMSLDGVILTGYDLEEKRERTLIAYFKYYRK